jgi:putative ABC transport system substrate-binding protein
MRRRRFIATLGAAAAWPLAARAQLGERMRRIGILLRGEATEGMVKSQERVLREELAKRGWIAGRNVQYDVRYSADDADLIRTHASELVGLAPDVIAASSFPATRAVLQQTRTIPVVFINVGDPVAGGLVKSISRPEGNATGITSLYQSLGSKWVELLKEAAPRTARIALVFDPEKVNDQYFGVIDAAAEVLAVKTVRTPYRDAAELERATDAFAAQPNGALLMVPPPPRPAESELINRRAVKYQLPTMYSTPYYVLTGGMMSYGSPLVDSYRLAATYVDRILRGAKVSELPVQFPTKIELTINLKTAKAVGLTLPRPFLLRADELVQ